MSTVVARSWVAYFFFIRWSCIQLGFHVDVAGPNIEIHIPFGFFRIGRVALEQYSEEELTDGPENRTFGYKGEWKRL